MPPFKAIIFDFDGTLVDTETFHFHIWNEILDGFGLKVSYEDYLKEFAGVPTPVNASMLVERHKLPISQQNLLEKREGLAVERLATGEFRMMAHARETLDFFFDNGFPIGLATGSPRADVEIMLDKMALRKYFGITVTRDDVKNSKPDPESYQRCVDHFGFAATDYLVFEDTPNGTLSAKNAGLTCYAVQHDTHEHARLQHADRIFADMGQALAFLREQKLV
jgi:HAD superfamily hydrolase (TIGR01509 family)